MPLLTILYFAGLGLGLIAAWALGFHETALWIYLVGAASRLMRYVLQILMVTRGVNFDPDAFVGSMFMEMEKGAWRFLLAKAMQGVGEAAVWPFRALIGGVLGSVIGARVEGGAMNQSQMSGYLDFRAPPTLQILGAFALQTVFLLLAISDEAQGAAVFRTVAAVEIAGFAAFALHFFGRGHFMKNFSASAMNPAVFAITSSVLAIGVAALVRLLFLAAFRDGEAVVSAEAVFVMLRGVIVNSGVLDIGDAIEAAETLDAFLDSVAGYLTSLDALRALDIFLGAFVISTFARAFWSAFSFSRDEEDHKARAERYLSAGLLGEARREAAELKPEDEAFIYAYAAAAEGNHAELARKAALIEKHAFLKLVGDEPVAVEFAVIANASILMPMPPRVFFALVEAHWRAHGSPAATLNLLANYVKAKRVPLQAIRPDVDAAGVFALSDEATEMLDEALKSGRGFADAAAKRFDKDLPATLILLSSWVITGWRRPDLGCSREAARDAVAEALRMALELTQASPALAPMTLASLPMLIALRQFHLRSFGERSAEAGELAALIERRIEENGDLPPRMLRQMKRARFRMA